MADKRAVVLVVEDDAQTREVERRILETGPYRVLEASNADEAFAVMADHPNIDLLIADLEMPGLSGEQMVARVRAKLPGQKVLYVSGVVDRLLDTRKILGEGEAFLDKPFAARGLLEAVSLLLYDTLTPPMR